MPPEEAKGVVSLLPIGIVGAMLTGAVGITMSVNGLSEKITGQRGDIQVLRTEMKHSSDIIAIKLDAVNARVQSLEERVESRVEWDDIRHIFHEMKALNPGMEFPDDY